MTCREFAEFLWKYLAGELPASQRSEFDAHLAICPACVAYLETYGETVRLARLSSGRGTDEVPDDVPGELVRAILAARNAGSPGSQ